LLPRGEIDLPRFAFVSKRGSSGIGKGAQHPGDVLERRGFQRALCHGSLWLSFEVDDIRLSVRVAQHLAEVVVTMNPNDRVAQQIVETTRLLQQVASPLDQ
jgi:hypothetical protein